MSRNRTVSSSAIARAVQVKHSHSGAIVKGFNILDPFFCLDRLNPNASDLQDAANGEFASAIETLVTAISLIKQSKVASDDRCKILISSLQVSTNGAISRCCAFLT